MYSPLPISSIEASVLPERLLMQTLSIPILQLPEPKD
jgi:hypothetical protein